MQTKHTKLSIFALIWPALLCYVLQCSAVQCSAVQCTACTWGSGQCGEEREGVRKVGWSGGCVGGGHPSQGSTWVEEVLHCGRAGLGGTLGSLVGEDRLVKVTTEGGLQGGLAVDIAVY